MVEFGHLVFVDVLGCKARLIGLQFCSRNGIFGFTF